MKFVALLSCAILAVVLFAEAVESETGVAAREVVIKRRVADLLGDLLGDNGPLGSILGLVTGLLDSLLGKGGILGGLLGGGGGGGLLDGLLGGLLGGGKGKGGNKGGRPRSGVLRGLPSKLGAVIANIPSFGPLIDDLLG